MFTMKLLFTFTAAYCALFQPGTVAMALAPPSGPNLALKRHTTGTKLAPLTVSCSDTHSVASRRQALLVGSAGAASALFSPLVAQAADTSSTSTSLSTLLKVLRNVPTFCIVNGEGVPYMLYKQNERNALGYAFITYPGALAVLGDAKRSSEKGGYPEVWETATITVVPLDIAVRLALQPRERQGQKDGVKTSSIVSLIPGIDEREAAVKVDGKFKDQAKVPLFFFDNMKLANGKQPMYFNPSDLIIEWKKQNGDSAIPPRIQVLELVAVFQYIMRGRAGELPFDLDNVEFVTTSESLEVASKLKAEGLKPYKTDRMTI